MRFPRSGSWGEEQKKSPPSPAGSRVSSDQAADLRPLLVGDLAVVALLPDVPDKVDARPVALLVVGDVADHRLERHAGMHDFRDLLGVERTGLFRRLLDDLHARIGIERVGFRLEALGAER